jgi:hypothetical protein
MYRGYQMGYELFKPGLSKFHHHGLIVPLLCVLSPVYLGPVLKHIGPSNVPLRALMYGFCTFLISYTLYSFGPLRDNYKRLGKSILLGLLTAELLIFSIPERSEKFVDRFPSPVITVFMLFMALVAFSEIETRDGLH